MSLPRIIRRGIEKMSTFFTDLTYIFSPSFNNPKKFDLFFVYLKISFKYFLSRWFNFKSEKFLSYSVDIVNYPIFYEIFRQVFVRQSYYFQTNAYKPFIIDGGGNMGMSVIYQKYLYPESEIIVFEPSENILPTLKINLSKNKFSGIRLIESALSDNDGEQIMYDRGVGACGDTLEKTLLKDAKVDLNALPKIINTKRLSSFITKRVDFLKLDIEGSEGLVIKELHDTNKLNLVEKISMEYHYYPENIKNSLPNLLNNLVSGGHGFQIYLEQIKPESTLGLEKSNSYYCLIKTIYKNSV